MLPRGRRARQLFRRAVGSYLAIPAELCAAAAALGVCKAESSGFSSYQWKTFDGFPLAAGPAEMMAPAGSVFGGLGGRA